MMLGGLPADRWELSAPESYLLRYAAGGTKGIGAFTLALKELVARDALRLEGARIASRWRGGRRLVWLITDGPRFAAITDPALTPVLALFERVRERRGVKGAIAARPSFEVEGVLLNHLLLAGAGNWHRFADYLGRDVAGSLERRGLLASDGKRTAEGRSADDLLDRWLELGKERFPSWAANRVDPRRALDYLQGAGAAILLVEGAYPAIARLGERLRSIGDPGGPALGIFEHSAAGLERLDGAFAVLDASVLYLGAMDGASGAVGF